MKKILVSILLSIMICLSLTGCRNDISVGKSYLNKQFGRNNYTIIYSQDATWSVGGNSSRMEVLYDDVIFNLFIDNGKISKNTYNEYRRGLDTLYGYFDEIGYTPTDDRLFTFLPSRNYCELAIYTEDEPNLEEETWLFDLCELLYDNYGFTKMDISFMDKSFTYRWCYNYYEGGSRGLNMYRVKNIDFDIFLIGFED